MQIGARFRVVEPEMLVMVLVLTHDPPSCLFRLERHSFGHRARGPWTPHRRQETNALNPKDRHMSAGVCGRLSSVGEEGEPFHVDS